MQINRKEYNPLKHDIYKALTVMQPWADLLTKAAYKDESGYCANKKIEVRTKNTSYRGELLICSSAKPVIDGHLSGVTCGLVELYDTKPIEEFTAEDWENTCIPEKFRPKKGFGWLMRNPRRVIEMPIKGKLGIYDIVVPKGDIMEYPRSVSIDAESWKIIKEKLTNPRKK
jgi:hypothetical protein